MEINRSLTYRPIGLIHSPFTDLTGMPIQPSGARGIQGTVQVFPQFVDGLKDLDGFSHIILLYYFSQSEEYQLVVKPFLDDEPHGVFATRAPRRPNPIGLSVVRLVRIDGSMLFIEDLDILDNTPLLDIKPFVPHFDSPKVERIGWLEKRAGLADEAQADDRFQ